MKYRLLYTEKALSDLSDLERTAAERIITKLDFFTASAAPLMYAKKLIDSRYGSYRFRIGDYRAIFDIDTKGNISVLLILRVKHRREVYL